MNLALFVLALALVGGGSAAVLSGAPIIVMERGWAMVISGTVAFSAGAILLGLCAVLRRLRALAALASRPAPRAEPYAPDTKRRPDFIAPDPGGPLVDPEPLPIGLPVTDSRSDHREPHPATSEPDTPADAPASPVVGSYEAGASSYLLYADGSILARTSAGTHRFDSLDALRGFVEELPHSDELHPTITTVPSGLPARRP